VFANLGSISRINISALGPFAPEAIAAAALPDSTYSQVTSTANTEEAPPTAAPLANSAAPLTAVTTPRADRSLEFALARHWTQFNHASASWNVDVEDDLLDVLLSNRYRRPGGSR
jgi:hypothetical protein